MRALGFLAELERNSSLGLPTLGDLAGKLDPVLAPAVIEYLHRGIGVFDVMEATPDPLNPGKFIPGGSSLFTDGDWVWRLDLPNYVSSHRLGLPTEFVSRACESVDSQVFPVVSVTPQLIEQALSAAGWA